MENKRILILGAGILQVPIIEEANRNGLKTLVFDYDKNAPGMKIASDINVVSIRDIDECVAEALKFNEKEKIDGVITVGTDVSTTAAKVSEKLKVSGIKYEDAICATNKIKMRERFRSFDIPQPNFYPASTYEDAIKAFSLLKNPVVIKPCDSMGSRGVIKVSDEKNVRDAFEKAKELSISKQVIIEEYMSGAEISIDMISYKGNIHTVGVADRIIERPPYFIETGHILPSTLPKEVINEAISTMKRGVMALNIKTGFAKGDIKITSDGAKIGEIAARLSGGFMSGFTYPYATGVNLMKNALDIAFNNEPSNITPKWDKVSMEAAIITEPGVVKEISGVDDALNIEGVKNIFIKVKVGDIIKKPTNNLEKAGNIIAVADTRDEVKSIISQALNKINISIS